MSILSSQKLTQIYPHLNVLNAEPQTGIHMCIYRSDMIQLLKYNAGPRIRVALHHEGRQLVDFNRDQTYIPTQDITRHASPMTLFSAPLKGSVEFDPPRLLQRNSKRRLFHPK